MTSNKPKIFYNSFAPQEIYDLFYMAAGDEFDIVTLEADDDEERCEKIADCDAAVVAGHKRMWGTEEGRHFPATPNTLVLFPSWLEHKTTENRSDNLRVSVAFNAR